MTAMPDDEQEREQIAQDARKERMLVPQALLALGIVVLVVIARELLLR